jgi:hypothetical protein
MKRRGVKRQCVDHLGGKCAICGYCRSLVALDFHHLDPTLKSKGIGILIQEDLEFENLTLQVELDKCVLLCCRCHRELHDQRCDTAL